MQDILARLIHEENKKNPLTDEQLSSELHLSRSKVTQLRQAIGIPDSRERGKLLLTEEIRKLVSQSTDISERKITAELNEKGFEVSRFGISRILKEVKDSIGHESEKPEDIKDRKQEPSNEEDEIFNNMIGWNKSLRVKIEQAKAAALYPPNGLHTLIVGATGVGKSELAECMYKFALRSRGLPAEEFPLIVFNCADYAENPQLLLAQLFGYKKGAFTGAEADRDGLVAKADGGILFLDEVHRLPPDGQEILYQLIDKGKYRKLGEIDTTHAAKVMIIAATTEDIEKNLLGAFCRRIPMTIELPPLSMRPIEERLGIIRMFFQQEAARINKKIIVKYNVLRTFLAYNCVGNIGQLRSDIQVACARGFLSFVAKNNENDYISVDFSCLSVHATKSLLNSQWDRSEIERDIVEDSAFLPDKGETEEIKESMYAFPSDFYKNLEEEYQKMSKHGLPDEIINKIISDDLEAKVKQVIKQVEKNKQKLLKKDLKTIVNPKIVDLVHEMLKVARTELGEIDDTLFYCLATHLNASLDRIKSGGKSISNLQLENIKLNNPNEFKIATEMASIADYYLGMELPEEEIGFIAIYLRSLAKKDISDNNIGIVVATHGHVAEGMASVANRLLGVNLVQTVEMSLDEKPEKAYEWTLEAVRKVNRGKGVLLLVDMGSLSGFGSFITRETGIVTRTVNRVDTLMVIDAVRKVLLPEANIDEVAESLVNDKNTKSIYSEEDNPMVKDKPAVISLCLTGEGTAQYIKDTIQEELKQVDPRIKIVTLGVIDDRNIIEQINAIRKNMNVLLIIGTINPYHPEIPFLPVTEILREGNTGKLMQMLNISYEEHRRMGLITYKEAFHSVFFKDIIMVKKNVKNKEEALHVLCELLAKKGYVSSRFIHGVLEREKLGTTAVENILAIPHGHSEDIILPAVGVMTLENPVEWYEGIETSLIFMLALNENSKNDFQRIYRIIKNTEVTNKIKAAENVQEIFNILESI
ncbi:MAG TPA: sigma 54-interacting transcriptional regulator [Anaerovoracaceae bacterium]|nr:sigma 54-interacting transcriptional regulator [Anaerovoracaceae bacterium]